MYSNTVKYLIKSQTYYQTLVSLYNITISSFYQALAAARISDSNWQPRIFVDIPPPQCVSDAIPSCIDIKKRQNQSCTFDGSTLHHTSTTTICT